VGFGNVELLFIPDAMSPKIQAVAGQNADVFVKLTVVPFMQE